MNAANKCPLLQNTGWLGCHYMRANGLHAHENKNLYALTAKEDIKDFQKDNTFFI